MSADTTGSAYGRPRAHFNETLAAVGPGTPCGELLRRYWQPVALSDRVRSVPRKVRILGEDLVLFSTQRVEPGFLAHQLTTTARIFCQGGRLNLIVGDARVDYVSRIPLYSAAPPPELELR